MNATTKSASACSSTIVDLIVLGGGCSLPALSADPAIPVKPATLPPTGTIDKRFQSFK